MASKNHTEDYLVLAQPLLVEASAIEQIVSAVCRGHAHVRDLVLYDCEAIIECKICRSLFRSFENFLVHKSVQCQDRITRDPILKDPEVATQPSSLRFVNGNSVPLRTHRFRQRLFDSDTAPEETLPTVKRELYNYAENGDVDTFRRSTAFSEVNHSMTAEQNAACARTTSSSADPSSSADDQLAPNWWSQLCPSTPRAEMADVGSGSNEETAVSAVAPPELHCHQHSGASESSEGSAPGSISPETAAGSSRTPSLQQSMGWHTETAPASTALARFSKYYQADSSRSVASPRCSQCRQSFTSTKTLHAHLLVCRATKKYCFPCIYCPNIFSQLWGVTRHIMRAHDKSKEHIEMIRSQLKEASYAKNDSAVGKRAHGPCVLTRVVASPVNENYVSNGMLEPTIECHNKDSEPVEAVDGDELLARLQDPFSHLMPKAKRLDLHTCSSCAKVFGSTSLMSKHSKQCVAAAAQDSDCVTMAVADSPPTCMSSSTPAAAVSVGARRRCRSQPNPTHINVENPFIEDQDSCGTFDSTDGKLYGTFDSSDDKPSLSAVTQGTHQDSPHSDADKGGTCCGVQWTLSVDAGQPEPSLSADQKDHIERILDKKGVACLKCGLKFGCMSNLRRHAVRHFGYQRYKCKLCDFKAYTRSECTAHLRKTHSKLHDFTQMCVQHYVVALPAPTATASSTESSGLPASELHPTKVNS